MLTLRPEQVEAFRACMRQDGSLLWGGVGTGKTIVAILVGHLRMLRKEVNRCVVLVHRTALADNFGKQLTQFYAGTSADQRRGLLRQALGEGESVPEEDSEQAWWTPDRAPPRPRGGTLGDTATCALPGNDAYPRWMVLSVQTVYHLSVSQKPPPFRNAGIKPRAADRVAASRWWREMCAQDLFGGALAVVDEAHMLRNAESGGVRAGTAAPAAGGGGAGWERSPPPPSAAVGGAGDAAPVELWCRHDEAARSFRLWWHSDDEVVSERAEAAPAAAPPAAGAGLEQGHCLTLRSADRVRDTVDAILREHERPVVLVATLRTLRALGDLERGDVHFRLARSASENRAPLGLDPGGAPRWARPRRREAAAAAAAAPGGEDPAQEARFASCALFWLAHARYALLLSATPVYNRPADLVPLCRALLERPTAWSFPEHRARPPREAAWVHTPADLRYRGPLRSLGALGDSLYTAVARDHVVRLAAAAAAAAAAPRTSRLHLVVLPVEHERHRRDLREACLRYRAFAGRQRAAPGPGDDTESAAENAFLGAYMALRKHTNVYTARENGEEVYVNPKAAAVRQIIDARAKKYGPGYRAVVFCSFKIESAGGAASIARALAGAGEVRVLTGDTPDPGAVLGAFNRDATPPSEESPTARILVCTKDMAGEGVGLFMVRDLFVEDMAWSAAALQQLVGRATRGEASHPRARAGWSCVDVWMMANVDSAWSEMNLTAQRMAILPARDLRFENLDALCESLDKISRPGEENQYDGSEWSAAIGDWEAGQKDALTRSPHRFPPIVMIKCYPAPAPGAEVVVSCGSADATMLQLIDRKHRENQAVLERLEAAAGGGAAAGAPPRRPPAGAPPAMSAEQARRPGSAPLRYMRYRRHWAGVAAPASDPAPAYPGAALAGSTDQEVTDALARLRGTAGAFYRKTNYVVHRLRDSHADLQSHTRVQPVILTIPAAGGGPDPGNRDYLEYLKRSKGNGDNLRAVARYSDAWFELRRGCLVASDAGSVVRERRHRRYRVLEKMLCAQMAGMPSREEAWGRLRADKRRALRWYRGAQLAQGEELDTDAGSFLRFVDTDIPLVGTPDGVVRDSENTISRLVMVKCVDTRELFNAINTKIMENMNNADHAPKSAWWVQAHTLLCAADLEGVALQVVLYLDATRTRVVDVDPQLGLYKEKHWPSLAGFYRDKYLPEVRAALPVCADLRRLVETAAPETPAPAPAPAGGAARVSGGARPPAPPDTLSDYIESSGL